MKNTSTTICNVEVQVMGPMVYFRWSTNVMECNLVKVWQCCLGGANYPNVYCTNSRYTAPVGTLAGNDVQYACVISNGGMKFCFGGSGCEVSATSNCTVCYGALGFMKFKN